MPGNVETQYKKKLKQVTIWEYLARVLPFVALFLLAAGYFIDQQNVYHIMLTAVIGTFFTIAVTWWFWAIKTIAHIFHVLDHTSENFSKIEKDLNDFKNSMHGDR